MQSRLKNFGAPSGAYFGEEFAAFEDSPYLNNNLWYFDSSEQMHSLLLTNRLDGTFVDPNAAFHYYRSRGKADEVEAALRIYTNDVHLILSRSSVSNDTVQAVNQALRAVIADGTIAKIIERYQQFNRTPHSNPLERNQVSAVTLPMAPGSN